MCDYSLTCISNRLAVEGEELVVHRFYTGSRGMAPLEAVPSQSTLWRRMRSALRRVAVPAVCIPPGARLYLTGISREVQRSCDVGPIEDVRFIQRSTNAYEHRDAIRFANGKVLPLQFLAEGQRAKVMALDGTEAVLDRSEAFA
jgi:hypothetical protein